MKKASIILMALALALGLTQCKKNEQPTTENTENTFNITLKVNNGSAKVDVNPTEGTVVFEAGDKIYVGSGGKYVGSLIHNGNHQFVGGITNPVEGEPLQFYFLGNVTPEEVLGAGSTEECSVVISDQTEHLPVISCAPSNEDFSFTNQTYTAHLLNKCALVKFMVTTPADTPICVSGMHNKVTVDFLNNSLTTSVDGEGVIILPAGYGENVEQWAILLPQDALDEGEEGTLYSVDGNFNGVRPAIPAVVENGYWENGITITVNTSPVGTIPGLFTINSNSDRVFFSQGNLQYQASTEIWRFAENQWDYVGNSTKGTVYEGGVKCNNQFISPTYTGWIDLFGWGTSGYNHGANAYRPWNNSSSNSDYYVYGWDAYNLYDQTGEADWGYNAISNGGNTENSGWRTLTGSESSYLFYSRNASTVNGIENARFVKAKVAGVQGVIVFPDAYTHPSNVTLPVGINDSGNEGWNENDYSVVDFSLMQSFGALFLPAAGQRNGTNLSYIGSIGYYWLSECNSSYYGKCINFNTNVMAIPTNSYRYYGNSVRLVRNAL